MLGMGIIGAGLIGHKRAEALQKVGVKLIGVTDLAPEKARTLAQKFSSQAVADIDELLRLPELQSVVVATSNQGAAEAIHKALKAGKHVLVEKPAGRNPSEVREWVNLANEVASICRVGFNHRFHPAIERAKQILEAGEIGPLMYVRARYGHGGRAGYDREWRADPILSGGGELLDQGVHLIDLTRWFAGEFELEFSKTGTFFWDMPVEDNGFLALRSREGNIFAWLHASCTEWKNIFEFELFGKTGKLQIVGLGGSYGTEQLFHYRRPPEGGVPRLESSVFLEEDRSWSKEMAAFFSEIQGHRTSLGQPTDALRAIELVYDAYENQTKERKNHGNV